VESESGEAPRIGRRTGVRPRAGSEADEHGIGFYYTPLASTNAIKKATPTQRQPV